MGREIIFIIQTDPDLGFRRGPLGIPIFVTPQKLGEVREGQRTTVSDPEGNCFGDVCVRDGKLLVSGAEHIAGYSGQLTPTNEGAVVDKGVVLQHRYPKGPSTMLRIRRGK